MDMPHRVASVIAYGIAVMLCLGPGTGCGGSTTADRDGSTTSDDAGTLDSSDDAMSMDAPGPPNADASCPCTPGDSSFAIVPLSLSCFCDRGYGCRDYDTALSTCYSVAVQELRVYES